MTFPGNLTRWEKISDNSCVICGEAVGTAKHILAGCRVLLDRGFYSRRHDSVLEIIREAVSLSVARAKKGLTTNTKQRIAFVKEATRTKNTKAKPHSILGRSDDWTILMDTYEKHYKFPEVLGVSASRPDIILYSSKLKHVVIVELTVPWETNIPKNHNYKTNKYFDLTNDIIKKGYKTQLYAVEVGARGIPAKSLHHLLKDLGLSRTAVSSLLGHIPKAALTGSYKTWIGSRSVSGVLR